MYYCTSSTCLNKRKKRCAQLIINDEPEKSVDIVNWIELSIYVYFNVWITFYLKIPLEI